MKRLNVVIPNLRWGVLLITLAFVTGARVQQAASYKLEEQVMNAGGHPAAGIVLTSASYRMTMDAIGEGVAGPAALVSSSYRADTGFVFAYPPPGEVVNLRFNSDEVTLMWDPERSVGEYNLYRDLLSALSGLGYGACEEQGITTASTVDAGIPPSGSGYFYLVTAKNRLAEEGTKGLGFFGERGGSSCP